MINLNQKGVSLVELMLALAIGGGVALLGSKLMSDQISGQKYVSLMKEINKITAIAQQNLSVKDACNKTFSIYQYSTNFTTGQDLPAILNASGSPVVKSGSYPDFSLAMTVTDTNLATNLKQVNLVFTYKPNSILPKKSTVKSEIRLFMNVDGNQNGQGYQATDKWKCGEVFIDSKTLAWEKLCGDLGTAFATWDSVNKICKINQFKCPFGQAPTSLAKLGLFTCKPAVQALDLSQMINTTPVNCPVGQKNYVLLTVVSGKYTIICNQYPTM